MLLMDQIEYLIDRIENIDQKFDEKLDKILVQTTRTNGRVNSLESMVKGHDDKIDKYGIMINQNKGRDNTLSVFWGIVVGAVGAVGTMLIQYFMNK